MYYDDSYFLLIYKGSNCYFLLMYKGSNYNNYNDVILFLVNTYLCNNYWPSQKLTIVVSLINQVFRICLCKIVMFFSVVLL